VRWNVVFAAAAALAMSTCAASAQDVSFGQRVFQDKADCQFGHGPEGAT